MDSSKSKTLSSSAFIGTTATANHISSSISSYSTYGNATNSTLDETCEIDADGVRVLYWPIDSDNSTASRNISNGPHASPYTTVSDGFTL